MAVLDARLVHLMRKTIREDVERCALKEFGRSLRRTRRENDEI